MSQTPFLRDDMRQEASDETLMVAIARGDREAFAFIVGRHGRRAHAVAYRLLRHRSDAEDVVQESFARLWVHAASWQADKAKFSTWFYRILTNACIDLTRKKKMVPLDEAPEVADPALSAEQQLAGRQLARQVERAIAGLPPRQQVALTLCYYEEFSNQHAADIMGVHIKALEGLLSRARQRLREILAPYGERQSI